MTALALAGKVVLVLVTIVCLLSIGGAMLFAFPVLVPLHWLAVTAAVGFLREGARRATSP